MKTAVELVKTKKLSLRKAAEMYGIPRATLHDHVSDKMGPDSSSGPERYLSVKEEEELVNFLVGCARIGYPRPDCRCWQ